MSVPNNNINNDKEVNPKWYKLLLVVNLLYVIIFYLIMQWVK